MKLNKYEQTIEAVLDLHGLYVNQAEIAVEEFIKNSKSKKHKIISIITGKGIHSEKDPVLKKLVKKILIKQNLNFKDAKIQEGGSGAIIIKL